MMDIAIIGTGNIGGALATKWANKGHSIYLGVNDIDNFKGLELLKNSNTKAYSIAEAVALSQIILIATPPTAVADIIDKMGSVTDKIIIDATNNVAQKIAPYATAYHMLIDKTDAAVVKCFNSTGFENIQDTIYNNEAIDMFMAGDNDAAKETTKQLVLDAGFGACIDFGKTDKVELLEKFALCWINLAIMQGHGRGIAFKLVKR
jgi:8-hydroxy-5-deazaflavin:NADPH oxidoreductase